MVKREKYFPTPEKFSHIKIIGMWGGRYAMRGLQGKLMIFSR